MHYQNKQIAIVGGGPGGLILARLLQLKGANVKVYERDLNKDARVQGSPLDMHEQSGFAALSKAGLVEEFQRKVYTRADKKIIVNEKAEIFFSDHDARPDEDVTANARPEIGRGVLRKILLESLQADTVAWNSHFVSMESQNEGWLLHFRNDSSAYADLVIAADGANSRIRPYLTNIKSFYTGIIMLEINVDNAEKTTPHIYKLLNGGKVMAFGNGKNILGGQKGNGGLGFYATFKAAENRATTNNLDYADKAQMLGWFKEEYAGWSSIWDEMFKNAVIPFIPRPICCMPLDQTWEARSNLTMLGDAAHVMPPFAGEGANTAMLDALELSEYLTDNKYHTPQDAIGAYEVNMRERAAMAAKRSLENGERMHSEGALEKMLSVFNKNK